MPAIIMDAILMMVNDDMREQIEPLLYQGHTDYGSYNATCKGFYAEMISDGTPQMSGVPLDETNIADELKKLYLAIPKVLMDNFYNRRSLFDLGIYVPTNVLQYLGAFYSNQPTGFNLDRLGIIPQNREDYYNSPWTIMGLPLRPTHGMADNTMFITYSQNLAVGLDLGGMERDMSLDQAQANGQYLNIIDMQPNNGDRKYRIDGALRLGTKIPKPEYAVVYVQP
jgi:hypothetical protein